MLTSRRTVGVVLAVAGAIVVAIVVSDANDVARSVPSPAAAGDVDTASESAAEAITDTATQIASPARDARRAASALREAVGEAIAGTGDDHEDLHERIGHRADRLRAAADELAQTSDTPVDLEQSSIDGVDEFVQRVTHLGREADELAALLAGAADDTEAVALAALELHRHTAILAAATSALPETDDPAEVADAWRDELERVEAHRRAAQAVAEHRALAELADIHLDVVDRLEATATAAIEHLDDPEVDDAAIKVYDEIRQKHLDDTATLGGDLLDAIQAGLDAAVVDIEHAEARTLGLLTELDAVRRDAPEQLVGT